MSLHVLHVVGGLPDFGKPQCQPFVASQIRSLPHAGVEVDVFDLAQLGNGWRKYMLGMPGVRSRLLHGHFDLVHAHYGYCGWVSRFQRRVPVVVSLMGSDLLGDVDERGDLTLRSRFDGWASQVLASLVEHVIVKSPAMLHKLRWAKHVTVLPNGVDFALFRPMDRGAARRALGIELKQRVVLFAADPHNPRKNYALAQAAVERLQSRIGSATLLPFFAQEQSRFALAANAADVLVMTSFIEGSPNVVKEAMACNLPVVSVDVGDVPEVICGTKHCHLADCNAEDIAANLATVLDAGERSDGRERIQHLRLELVAQNLVRVYSEVLERCNA